jgi:hypothetical protein
MDPRGAIACLGQLPAEGKFSFLGTCFSFRRPDRFLTAQHCVKGVADLVIISGNQGFQVAHVITHDKADAAILQVDAGGKQLGEPFAKLGDPVRLGEDFHASGFVSDLMPPSGTPGQRTRAFRPYVQRTLLYDEQSPYRYLAAELSMACPAGLSGGPLFPYADPAFGVVTGLITTNVDVAMAHEAFEEIEERTGNETKIVHYRRVITYGIALLLYGIREWLDEQIPT